MAKISPLLLGVTISVASCSNAASQTNRDDASQAECSTDATLHKSSEAASDRKQPISARPTGNRTHAELASMSPRQVFLTGASIATIAQSRNSKPVEAKHRKRKNSESAAISTPVPR
jgi:hypothetical protein